MKRLILFVHYNKKQEVAAYVFNYLEKLAEISDRIIFISNSDILEHDKNNLKIITNDIIIRKNHGYDFMAWRDGLRYLGYENLNFYDELITANDSNYGPLFSFDNIFDKVKKVKCDFWGITESSSFRPHLQSSFLVFKKNVFTSNVFKNFWENIKVENSKNDIIKKYELGLQEQLESSQFSSHTLFKIKLSKYEILKYKLKRIFVLIKRKFSKNLGYYNKKTYLIKNSPKDLLLNFLNLNNVNVTICCWEELIKMGCPLLKVEVLRDNSYGLSNINNWENIIKKYSKYDTNLIKEHLK